MAQIRRVQYYLGQLFGTKGEVEVETLVRLKMLTLHFMLSKSLKYFGYLFSWRCKTLTLYKSG